jgi:predicted phosphodiesterase
MRVLVLSDIHGNLEALEAVLNEASEIGWEQLWFLGDLCGYGPDSEACFQRLREYKLTFLCGNHDLYISGALKGDFFSDSARKALILGRADINFELRLFLSTHSSSTSLMGTDLVHGSPIDPTCNYILNGGDVQASLSQQKKKLLLFGHTHIQTYFTIKGPRDIEEGQIDGKPLSLKGKKIWINPGSVGQPRDGDNRAAWGILDRSKKEFQFYRTPYNYEITQQKMRQKGYPDFLIDRLNEGK